MQGRKLIYSAWKTPDGTLLHSKHRHDYVTHFDSKSKEVYALDGGIDYQKCTINKVPPVDLSVYSDDSHEKKREVFVWGTYGKNGDKKLGWVALQHLTTDHIGAILLTQDHLEEHIQDMFRDELRYRKENNV